MESLFILMFNWTRSSKLFTDLNTVNIKDLLKICHVQHTFIEGNKMLY